MELAGGFADAGKNTAAQKDQQPEQRQQQESPGIKPLNKEQQRPEKRQGKLGGVQAERPLLSGRGSIRAPNQIGGKTHKDIENRPYHGNTHPGGASGGFASRAYSPKLSGRAAPPAPPVSSGMATAAAMRPVFSLFFNYFTPVYSMAFQSQYSPVCVFCIRI